MGSKGVGNGCKGVSSDGKGDDWSKGSGVYGKSGVGKLAKSILSLGKSGVLGKGKGKKGKKDRGPSGPNLERTRITEDPVTGEVKDWKGKYGWITPTVPVEHEMAVKHKGELYVSMTDIVSGETELTKGSLCQFHVFVDANGLGAEEVI